MQQHLWKSAATALSLAAAITTTTFAADRPQAGEEHSGNYNFLLEIAGAPAGQFTSVTGLTAETEVVEYREGGDDNLVRKLPGRLKYSNIVLKRGYVHGPVLREWIWTTLDPDGMVERRDGALTLRDRVGNVVARYEFFDAWPCKWSGFTPDDESDPAFMEEIVICVEFFREVLPGGD